MNSISISITGNVSDDCQPSLRFIQTDNKLPAARKGDKKPKDGKKELLNGMLVVHTPVWQGLTGELKVDKLNDAGVRYVSIFDADTDTLLKGLAVPKPSPLKKAAEDESLQFTRIGSTLIHNYRLELLDERGVVTNKLTIARSEDVLITLPDGAIGDTLAWFPACDKFQRKHNCKVTAVVPRWFIELAQDQYPNVKMITYDEIEEEQPFAMYQLGVFFGNDTWRQPIDFKFTGLHKTVCNILGVSDNEERTKLKLGAPRTIKEKYVCIAAQGSSKTKCWNNPWGWYLVVKYLKAQGYRVLCIDKSPVGGDGVNVNIMPPGVEDFTGALPLQERIDLLQHADFFIGLPSGLSWLAWCCNVPVVMISGFSLPFSEFYTPYRVINYNGCTGCWNDMRELFDHHDYCWCPRHKGTPRQFECSRIISPKHVIDMIKTIPEYQPDNPELTLEDIDNNKKAGD